MPSRRPAGRSRRPGRRARNCGRPATCRKRRKGAAAGRAAFVHAIAHIELNAIDLAWDLVARFTDEAMPPAFYDGWVGVARDEAEHFDLLSKRLHALGSAYGALPAHDGLWQAADDAPADDLLARLAVEPMLLEARGLDTTPDAVKRLTEAGDGDTAALLETIGREEILHVAAGARWFEYLAARRRTDRGLSRPRPHAFQRRHQTALQPRRAGLGRHGGALLCGGLSASADPSLRTPAWTPTAVAQHRAGRPDLAVPVYRRLADAFPGDADVKHMIAITCLQKGDAAGGAFERALDLESGSTDAQFNLANALARLGRFDEALALYRAVAEVETDNVDALNNLGGLLSELGRRSEAIGFLVRAHALAPRHVGVLGNLVDCLERLNRLDEAEDKARALVTLAPESSLAQILVARVERRRGHLQRAAERLERIAGQTGDRDAAMRACFDLGQVQDRLDDADRAFAAFREGNRRQAAARLHGRLPAVLRTAGVSSTSCL